MKNTSFLHRTLSTTSHSIQPNSLAHRIRTWFLISCFFGQSILPSYANIIADPQAARDQQPIILSDAKGNPLINIQTPNSQGLSHNRYTQFDVKTGGATLNNQRGSNPYLAKGTAKVILNEVRSTNPSKLEGMLKVQGDKADVIIANPSGIVVNGGGISNAHKAMLTTGQIHVQQEQIQQLNVQKGKVVVGAKGMDNRQTDYTQVISRAVEIQGKLQANNISIATGNQQIDYITGEQQRSQSDEDKPAVGIDIAQLGGIYADSIYLVANEHGAGVYNAGNLKANHRIVVTSSGKIVNLGEIVSQNTQPQRAGTVTLETLGSKDIVSSKGKIEGKTRVTINSGRKVSLKNTQVKQTDKEQGAGILIDSKRSIRLVNSQLSTQQGNVSLSSKNYIFLNPESSLNSNKDILLHADNGEIHLDASLETKTEAKTVQGKRRIFSKTIPTYTVYNDSIITYPLSLTAKGNIKIIAPRIEINGASLTAGEDLSLITNKDSLFINGISAKFNQYQTNKHQGYYEAQLKALSAKIDSIVNPQEYKKLEEEAELWRKKSSGVWDKEQRYLKDQFREKYRELKRKLKQLDSLATEEKKQKADVEKMLAVLNQKGRGHEYKVAELKAKNIHLFSQQGINIEGAKLSAEQKVNIYATGILPRTDTTPATSININGVFDSYEYGGGDHYAYAIFNNPTVISGKSGIDITTTAQDGALVIGASHLFADNGKISLYAYDDIHLLSGQGELYTYDKHSYKTGKWYNRKHVTEIKEHRHAKADPAIISAKQGIDILTGKNLNAYATIFDAPRGRIHITAGQGLNLYAVDEVHYDKLERHKRSKFLGIQYNKTSHTSTAQMKSALPARVVAQSSHLKSGWDTLLQGTQFSHSLAGSTIQAGVGEKARKDARIILQGIKTTIQTEEHHQSNSIAWQKMEGWGELVETLSLPSFSGFQPVFNAPNGILVDIPQGNLKTELEKLIKKPEYAYLKQLENNENVDWRQVALAYDKWDYKQEGLSPAAAAVIALAVAVGTGGSGVGASFVSTATGASLGPMGAAMANAAFASLASQSSLAIINNKGDFGKAFKELGSSNTVKRLATAVITAGVAHQVLSAFDLTTVTEASSLMDRFSESLIHAGSAAVVNSAINGESLSEGLEIAIISALAQTLHGQLSQYIKGINSGNEQSWYRQVAHKLAHAVVGCASAAAQRGKCADGAMGAAVGEVVAEILLDGRNPTQLSHQERQTLINKTKLIVGSIAALTNRDVNVVADSADTAVRNNAFFIPLLALAGAYTAIAGDGDMLLGLEQIGRGDDPLSQALATGVDKAVEMSMENYPEATTFVLNNLSKLSNVIGEATSYVDATVSYIDDLTGNVVSSKWNALDESTRAKILGAGTVTNIILPATTIARLRTMSQSVDINVSYQVAKQITHRQDLINSLAKQINRDNFKMQDLVLYLGKRSYVTIPELSKGAAVYKGVSEKEIFKLFQDLAGASKMPSPMEKFDSSGKKIGDIYVIKDSKGNIFHLRNISHSNDKTNAKWTIDIKVNKALPEHKIFKNEVELKFQ